MSYIFKRAETIQEAYQTLLYCVFILCALGIIEVLIGLFSGRVLVIQGLYTVGYAAATYGFKNSAVTFFCFLWSLLGLLVTLGHPVMIFTLAVSLIVLRTSFAVTAWNKLKHS